MERIYLDCIKSASDKGIVKVAVFLKDVSDEHFSYLVGFLQNQNMKCSYFSENDRKSKIQELGYFDDAFIIEFSAKRWSFFDLRSYLHSFLAAWEEDVLFCGDYFKDVKSRDAKLKFNDSFYLQLSRLIDSCEDRYFIGNHSISLFIDGILRILKENLQLYWVAAKLKNNQNGRLTYLNHVPSSIPRNDIISQCSKDSTKQIRVFPVIFNNNHISDFYVCPGPFSPEKEVIDKFVEYVLMHIDDFIFGDINLKQQSYKLNCKIAELEVENSQLRKKISEIEAVPKDSSTPDPQSHSIDLMNVRIILIGDTRINRQRLLVEFEKVGFNKQKVELRIEYDKAKQLNINNLKRIRSKYDGILLGPMPHKVKGDILGESLIGMMKNNTDEYPPFAVCKERSGKLKITNNSLKLAIKELLPKIDDYNNYMA